MTTLSEVSLLTVAVCQSKVRSVRFKHALGSVHTQVANTKRHPMRIYCTLIQLRINTLGDCLIHAEIMFQPETLLFSSHTGSPPFQSARVVGTKLKRHCSS
jgi:hypothetical protein